MSMATRCPACDTVFRVTPQQLQAHRGQVRCGRCMTVFDGFRGLATLSEDAAEAVEPRAAATTDAQAAEKPAAPEREPAAAAEIPEFGLEPVDLTPAAAIDPAAGVAPPAAAPRNATIGPGIAFEPKEDDEIYPDAPRRRWPWAVGAGLLALALAGQAAYFYRSELAVQYPAVKPALVELCRLAGCSVPLPQRPKLINIEASDLQVVDPARPGVIQLTATLRNHAPHDVGFPALDLVLTNTREHTLARRIFLPAEYLAPGRDPAAGIPAKGEMTIRVDLDTGDLNAAGFRLELLPAPQR